MKSKISRLLGITFVLLGILILVQANALPSSYIKNSQISFSEYQYASNHLSEHEFYQLVNAF